MSSNLQIRIFELIEKFYPKRSQAVEALSEILNLGKDAIYRRIRGETLLTPDEMQILAIRYHLSLDAIIHKQTDTVFFSFNPFAHEVSNFEDYLIRLKIELAPTQQYEHIRFYYASNEIPIFLYGLFPRLLKFKLFVWGRIAWNLEYLNNRPYEESLIAPHVVKLAEELLDNYLNVPSIELLSLTIIDNTINQIDYMVNSGNFKNPNDAMTLCEDLIQMVLHIKSMAEKGQKFHVGQQENGRGNYELYHNEMIYTNNTILVATPIGKSIFTSYGDPNFLKTSDRRICDFTEEWFTRTIDKSNNISKSGEKNRNWYFNKLVRKVEVLKNRLSLDLEE